MMLTARQRHAVLTQSRRAPTRVAPRRRCNVAATASYRTTDVEAAKRMLDREGYRLLDVRTQREYDQEHLTKPPRCTLNVPLADEGAAAGFVAAVGGVARPSSKLLVVRAIR